MEILSNDQIEIMFKDFGLDDENIRQSYLALQALANQPIYIKNFILLDSSSEPKKEGLIDAKLA